MAKAVDIIDGILFVRTRHYDDVKMVVVRHQEKPEKRFYKVNESNCCGSCYLCDVGECGAKMKGGGDHGKK